MATIASDPERVRVRTHDWSVAHVAGIVSYWLIIAASYLTYGFLFYYAAKEKLFDDSGTMPDLARRPQRGSPGQVQSRTSGESSPTSRV